MNIFVFFKKKYRCTLNKHINLEGGIPMDNYKIAEVTSEEKTAIEQAEKMVKSETGKEYIIVAWEKK